MMESLAKTARPSGLARSSKRIVEPKSGSFASDNRLKVKEYISWSLCFAVVAGITGMLLIYKIGVTMSVITSILFYSSLLGFIGFTAKAILSAKPQKTAGGEIEPTHLYN
jgi:hypothetical protein